MDDERNDPTERVKQRDNAAKRLIIQYVVKYGKAYSHELTNVVDLSIATVRRLLKELERDRLVESWIVHPPHADNSNSNLQRLYYRLPFEEETE
jgi:DeoR/GlpR family transcriptional regulator of sugar metabolism